MLSYRQGFKPRVYVNVRDKTAQMCGIKWTKRSREKTVGLSSYGLFVFEIQSKGNEYETGIENRKLDRNRDE